LKRSDGVSQLAAVSVAGEGGCQAVAEDRSKRRAGSAAFAIERRDIGLRAPARGELVGCGEQRGGDRALGPNEGAASWRDRARRAGCR